MQNQASGSLKADIQSARVEVSREIADLQSAQGCSDMTCINAALDRYYADYDASANVFVLLRSDLGLPPPPAASPTAS